ncbi:MAG: gamma-glutamyltransferase [Melioribacteraceae bacterium]|nr:gamma-glutamyltransferase [Melioribacteraceae bacterium]
MRTSISFKLLICICSLFMFQTLPIANGHPVRSKNGMVVTASPLASDAGVSILKKGGNAVDAAVAVGFALAVTYPSAGNIGGGGFMVIHLANGINTTLDFRETAPIAAFENMFLDSLGNYNPDASQLGWKSSGVPGTVHGLITALEKYGSLSLSDVIQPAIDLAEEGFKLTDNMANSINYYYNDFMNYESSKKIFTNNGNKYSEGDLFIQKDLANTLKSIRDNGIDGFYKKNIAQKFIDESNKNDGIFSIYDLEQYATIEREPIIGTYRGHQIVSMAPPSSGGICLIEALNVLENFNFNRDDWGSSRYFHILVETFKRVYADRSIHLGDADFYPVPVNFLTSKKYAQNIANSITENALPSEMISGTNLKYKESEETTHYSVADKSGNAVAVTYTLNSSYGNRIVVDGLGFLLNNEMDDFSAKPGVPNQFGLIGSKANSIQPKKRMLSSMTPTIVFKDDKPFMLIGSPGGSTIITQVLQTIQNVIDFGMNIYDAIDAPRIHHQWLPDEIYWEPIGISPDTKQILIEKGHKFGPVRPLGRMEGIIIDSNEKIFYGTSDPRAFGKAAGY